MQQRLIGILVASAAVLYIDTAQATCNPAQVAGTYSFVSIFVDALAAPISLRCPNFAITHNTANKYNINAACILYRPGGGSVAYNFSGTGGLVINPANCRGSGTFTISHNAIPDTATILQWQVQSPGVANATLINGVIRLGTDTASISFTMLR